MRKVSVVVGLSLLMVAGAARAQDEAPAAAPADSAAPAAAPAPETVAAPAAPAASDSKMQAGVNLLPMALGKAKGESASADLKFAYGVGLHFDYFVIPGLSVGVAPQMIFNLKPKDFDVDASKEYDLMARIAYSYIVAPKFAVYAEVLPGYSIISPPSGSSAKGIVLAGGVGAMMDVTDQVFVNLGIGYQYGLQKESGSKSASTFLRIALGAGVKF